MLYLLSWLMIIFTVSISLLAIGTYFSSKYPESSFALWFKQNIMDEDPDENY